MSLSHHCVWRFLAIHMYDIYDNARDNAWRFTLGKHGMRPLITVGLNPSTATAEQSDTTIAKVDGVARRHGFDGFIMLNLYPVRATDYNALPMTPDATAFEQNLARIETVVSTLTRPVLWAAWGESVLARPFFIEAALALHARLMRLGAQWQHLGQMTRSGHPRHPSRLHYAWSFSPMDADHYFGRLAERAGVAR